MLINWLDIIVYINIFAEKSHQIYIYIYIYIYKPETAFVTITILQHVLFSPVISSDMILCSSRSYTLHSRCLFFFFFFLFYDGWQSVLRCRTDIYYAGASTRLLLPMDYLQYYCMCSINIKIFEYYSYHHYRWFIDTSLVYNPFCCDVCQSAKFLFSVYVHIQTNVMLCILRKSCWRTYFSPKNSSSSPFLSSQYPLSVPPSACPQTHHLLWSPPPLLCPRCLLSLQFPPTLCVCPPAAKETAHPPPWGATWFPAPCPPAATAHAQREYSHNHPLLSPSMSYLHVFVYIWSK